MTSKQGDLFFAARMARRFNILKKYITNYYNQHKKYPAIKEILFQIQFTPKEMLDYFPYGFMDFIETVDIPIRHFHCLEYTWCDQLGECYGKI